MSTPPTTPPTTPDRRLAARSLVLCRFIGDTDGGMRW
jgi:hypothetical protein